MTPPVDGRGLVAAAIAGDAGAQATIDRVGTTLGTALAGAVALLDPGLVIISGGLADAVDTLAPSLARRVASPTADPPARRRGRERRARAIGRVGRCSCGGTARRELVGGGRLMATMIRNRTGAGRSRSGTRSSRRSAQHRQRRMGDRARIPGEDRLSRVFGVSRITLRHALRNLEEHGLLRREHGRGTFVRSTRWSPARAS